MSELKINSKKRREQFEICFTYGYCADICEPLFCEFSLVCLYEVTHQACPGVTKILGSVI